MDSYCLVIAVLCSINNQAGILQVLDLFDTPIIFICGRRMTSIPWFAYLTHDFNFTCIGVSILYH